ncbi:FAD-linked oxidoreductase-like protein [Lineolata rhizophorae]|uniref:Proline dehydrogenase n=1 Tax=Lineolata rhizophorae TaxID=578093 RepID=A0A6A6P3C9_9PEZI|nr:FAD-linked oxidoreductase-like protein [Lineolata rhizophorae]
MSSSPALLSACFTVLNALLRSKSPLTNVEKNPILSAILKNTFYAQFCAGENEAEVRQTRRRLGQMGYDGVILEYALEVLEAGEKGVTEEEEMKAIEKWKKGCLDSVSMAEPGDFLGLKWSGLGPGALSLLKSAQPPTPAIASAISTVCTLASTRSVGLLPGAEESGTNPGIDAWTLSLQRSLNRNPSGKAIMYSTYQAYLKTTPATLAAHLETASREGFTLGVKLVRGAYLAGEQRRGLAWDTKEETDCCYDELAERLLRREYGGLLQPPADTGRSARAERPAFPRVDLVLATHNLASVRKAQALRARQAERGEERIPLAYAQLMGMADEVSCELLQAVKAAERERRELKEAGKGDEAVDVPRALKCSTWGSTAECLNFLLRRAAENRDAASRTADTRDAMGREIWRRTKASVGLS